MRESALKNLVGIYIILLHALLVVLVLYFHNTFNMHWEYISTALPIVVPVFAAYVSIIVSNFLNESKAGSRQAPIVTRTLPAVFVSFFFPTAVFAVIAYVLYERAMGSFPDEAMFKYSLGIGELAFGSALSMVVLSLFDADVRVDSNSTPGNVLGTPTSPPPTQPE